ncbi:hypothetical protein A6302_02563 [Methylobrevis pamukkalensis]|uniref:Uncharacterized protein n=2 Tax=Methylobrevis pamukkalensis TaxID=1439726 RepID=A0A1E3H1D5_9HYPH|nr:hypothetical protein A6302_02563 [Methylobrevis pamukkalensis]
MHTGLVTAGCIAGLGFAIIGFSQAVDAHAEVPRYPVDLLVKADPVALPAPTTDAAFVTTEMPVTGEQSSVLIRLMAE